MTGERGTGERERKTEIGVADTLSVSLSAATGRIQLCSSPVHFPIYAIDSLGELYLILESTGNNALHRLEVQCFFYNVCVTATPEIREQS